MMDTCVLMYLTLHGGGQGFEFPRLHSENVRLQVKRGGLRIGLYRSIRLATSEVVVPLYKLLDLIDDL